MKLLFEILGLMLLALLGTYLMARPRRPRA